MSRLVRQVHTIVCLYLLLYCTGAFVAPAQEFRGSLLATILDSTRSRIPGACVSLTQDKFGAAADLDEVPLSARSFANIPLLAPFTAPVEPSDPTKARITAVSFGGSSGLNVDLSVDGGDNNDDYIGGFLQNYSPEAIQEFVVRTSQFGADTSHTNGGSGIISTRNGTNDWHGSLSYYYRGQTFNARNALDNPAPNPKQPFSRQNGVATLGGPIKHGQLWFFSAYEYIDAHTR